MARSSMRDFRHLVPALLWMGFIYWMSTGMFSSQNTASVIEPVIRFFAPSISCETMGTMHASIRKLGHLTEYFILGLLLFRGFRRSSGETPIGRQALLSVLVLALYAATDEFHQSFVSARTASPCDVGIDILGGILSQCAIMLRRRILHPSAAAGRPSKKRLRKT